MWSRTFERFPAGKTPILGAITVAVYDWTRPQSGTSRLFDQDVLERLTCARPTLPIALYLPAGIVLAGWAIVRGMPLTAVAAWYVAGLLVWSLFEYLMHRFSFHHTPRTRLEV